MDGSLRRMRMPGLHVASIPSPENRELLDRIATSCGFEGVMKVKASGALSRLFDYPNGLLQDLANRAASSEALQNAESQLAQAILDLRSAETGANQG